MNNRAMPKLLRWQQAFIAGLAMVAMALTAVPSLATTQRLALVIGNNAYADGALKNPINDARTMATPLGDLGFEVHKLENADRSAMQRAVLEFGRKLSQDTVAVASLKSAPLPSKPNSAFVDTGDLGNTLRQNWSAVEAALKAHVTAEYNTYRQLIPANNALVTDVRLNKATLERVLDVEAGRIGVLLEGMLQSNFSYGSNQILWRPFTAQFTYDVKFVDGKAVIGPYNYVQPGQAQAAQ